MKRLIIIVLVAVVLAITAGAISQTTGPYPWPTGTLTRSFGLSFVNGGSSPLVAGAVYYKTVPYACTITGYNINIAPNDTATFDVWEIASGTANPTVANTIISTGAPAISTGGALQSTAVSGWTAGLGLSVAKNSIVGIKLTAVGGTATQATLEIVCQIQPGT